MKTFIKALYSILFLVLLIPAALIAAPANLYYQGRLVNAAGNPYTLPQVMHFKIYNVPSGGAGRAGCRGGACGGFDGSG